MADDVLDIAQVSRCRKCEARIVWAVTDARGKANPLDREPDPHGRLVVVAWQVTDYGIAPVVHHLRAEAVDESTNFDEGFGHQTSSNQKATANSASANRTRKIDCTTASVVRRPSSREESRTCRPR